MRNFLSHTVWAPGAVAPEDWKYRNLKRIMFPGFDFLMMLSGIACILYGVPTLLVFFPVSVVEAYGFLMFVAGLASFLGSTIPKLWQADIAGSIVLLGLGIAYLVSIALRSFLIDNTRVFGFYFFSATVTIIIWRLSILSGEWQERRHNARDLSQPN